MTIRLAGMAIAAGGDLRSDEFAALAAFAAGAAVAVAAAGRSGERVSLTIGVSVLRSGADRSSIIDLPTAPSMTATLHTA